MTITVLIPSPLQQARFRRIAAHLVLGTPNKEQQR